MKNKPIQPKTLTPAQTVAIEALIVVLRRMGPTQFAQLAGMAIRHVHGIGEVDRIEAVHHFVGGIAGDIRTASRIARAVDMIAETVLEAEAKKAPELVS